MRLFLTLEEAWEETLGRVQPLGVEEVPLVDGYGRVLASPLLTKAPIPPFDRSALDGFAVRAEDIFGATPSRKVILDVIEEVGAGRMPSEMVGPGQAIRIMTGAPIPVGADAILRLEATEPVEEASGEGDEATANAKASAPKVLARIYAMMDVPQGEAISRQGEDAPQGTQLLAPGCVIGAAETALLAANGDATVRVYKRPRIGILVSGEEVRPLTGELLPGQIRDSNGPMLAALVRDLGGEPVLYGQVGDDLEATVSRIQQMANECDIVLTTGGVSVGDYDLMREAYMAAGGSVIFWKVRMRPGTPVTFAEVGGTPIFGLSGNPAAAYVNFALLVSPSVRKMAGHARPELRPIQARLDSEHQSHVIGLDRFLRATLSVRDGVLTAHVPGHGQKAAILSTLVGVEGLVRIPARTEIEHGAMVDVYPIRGSIAL